VTGHRNDCLFVRDGGRSICTCWPESSSERAALKETTLNEIGLALGRVESALLLPDGLFGYRQRMEKRLEAIESKQDSLGEATDRIEESLKAIIAGMIDRLPEPRVQPVRRATKKGKRR
jgi:hypothetical protein